MTRRPFSTPVRALAAFSYLAPVAIVLLAIPAYRQIRLIRVHALASLVLTVASVLVVVIFGSLTPGAALELALFVGLVISLAMMVYFGAAIWSAIWAYQGKNPPVPGASHLANRFEKRLAPRREVK